MLLLEEDELLFDDGELDDVSDANVLLLLEDWLDGELLDEDEVSDASVDDDDDDDD